MGQLGGDKVEDTETDLPEIVKEKKIASAILIFQYMFCSINSS